MLLLRPTWAAAGHKGQTGNVSARQDCSGWASAAHGRLVGLLRCHRRFLRGAVTDRCIAVVSAGVSGKCPGAHSSVPRAWGELQLPKSGQEQSPSSSALQALGQARLNLGVK